MTTGTVEMVTSSITSSSSLCRIATPPLRCTRRTPYLLRTTLQRVQAESLLPGVPRRALQVAQSLESEALFQLGALETTATPAASKAAARTRSHRRDLRTPDLTKHQPKSRMRENRTSGFVPRLGSYLSIRDLFSILPLSWVSVTIRRTPHENPEASLLFSCCP